MRLSTRARYALRVMIAITRMNGEQQPVSLARVAERAKLPHAYLEKLVMSLKRASLLRPVSGRSGGYLLAQPAEDIRLAEIVQATIGPINVVPCVNRPASCIKADLCECRLLYVLVNSRIVETLNEYSLADMAGATWREKIMPELARDDGRRGRKGADRPGAR